VLVGHVDSARQGEGAFFALHSLAVGTRVVVSMTDGRPVTYRVASREQFPKSRVPLQSLFATTGAPRLTLITCGGSFDETIRSYRDNLVVTATR
jgi:sortase (surface protein transpeptidase)